MILKGVIQDFFIISSLRRELSPNAQMARAQWCANHVQTSGAYHVQH